MPAPEQTRETPPEPAPAVPPAQPAPPAAPRGGVVLHGAAWGFGAVAGTLLVLGGLALAFPKAALDAYANWQELTGTGPRGGLLFIEAPQVYTRERLVNDRFDQANWLNHELELSAQDSAAARQQAAARALDWRAQTDIRIARGAAPAADAALPGQAPPQATVQMEPTEVLDRRLEYRNKVRSELMDTQLDDSHDLDGNTLYRFNFDTVVMPWADVRRYPGTAVFLITAQSTRPEHQPEGADAESSQARAEQIIETRDNLELLQSWQREIQNFLTKVVKYRIENFYTQEPTENKTDPKEDILFEFFLRWTLMNTYIDMLSANIVAHCALAEKPCPPEWHPLPTSAATETDRQLSEEAVKRRRYIVARLLNVAYKDTFGENLAYPPRMEMGFRGALLTAHTINTLQWPKLSARSYRPDCAQQYSASDASPADIERDCLLPYSDKGFKRAMIRLILVLEAMKTKLESHGKPVFPVGELDFSGSTPPKWFIDMTGAFRGIRPEQADIDTLAKEVDAIHSDARSLPLLERVEASCEDAASAPYVFTSQTLIDYGRCRFLRANAAKIENVVARFIHQRIIGGHTMFGEMAVTNFVDVDKVGCDVTECRIEVRSKVRDDLLCPQSGPAAGCTAADALPNVPEDTRRALVRTMGDCYSIISDRVTPTHAAALARRERYRFIGQDKDFHLSGAEKMVFFDCATAFELRNWLEEANVNVAVYEISPHTGGIVVDRSATTAVTGGGGVEGAGFSGGISRSSEARDREVGVTRVVIGFGQLGPNPTGVARQANFGWVIRPQEGLDGRWMPGHYRLSAIISVPSWWKRLKFTIKACWTTPEKARAIGFGMVNDPEAVCQEEPGQPSAGGALMKRDFIAQLPRRTEDVTERFRFDFIKAPFLDDQWLASMPQLRLEAGRPGKLVILGGRLWRGTVATVMGQPANKITVLPDMKGVIAEFDCVATPAEMGPPQGERPGGPPAAEAAARKASVQKLTVWTSEGRTQDMPVEVYPFNPAFGGRPCDAPPLAPTAAADAPRPAAAADAPRPAAANQLVRQ